MTRRLRFVVVLAVGAAIGCLATTTVEAESSTCTQTQCGATRLETASKQARIGRRGLFLGSTTPTAFVTTTTSRGQCAATTPPKAVAKPSFSQRLLMSASSSSSSSSNTAPPATVPLDASSGLAGRIEAALVDKFGASNIGRILDSFRWLSMGYEHQEFIADAAAPGTTRESSHCHQHAPSFVNGLTTRTFWDTSSVAWAKFLESNYDAIRREVSKVMPDERRLQQQGNNVWSGALTEDASSYGVGWKTLVLMERGRWDSANTALFPETAKLVLQSKIPATEVFFARMDPHSEIQWHSDFTNFVLTSHLALKIPSGGKCQLTIGDDVRDWINGQVLLFDTSILHRAINEADETRLILMFRLWHPDLTAVEREALQFIYDAIELPELVDFQNVALQRDAQNQLDEWKRIPAVLTSSGFGASGGGMGTGSTSKSKKSGKKRKK